MAEKILLVEDEEKLARMVELELQYEGYQVDKAFDGRTGLDRALSGEYDLVLLDIMLPALSGMEVLRRLRKESQLPVIMLTARDTVVDKVSGLDMGADDYITKPFAIEELLARIRAALRKRPAAPADAPLLTCGSLVMDVERHTVEVDGRGVELTRREFDLLHYLLENMLRAFSGEALASMKKQELLAEIRRLLDSYVHPLPALQDRRAVRRQADPYRPGRGLCHS